MKRIIVVAGSVICLYSVFSIAQQAVPTQAATTPKKAVSSHRKPVHVSTNGTILISTDMDCMVKIDDGDDKYLPEDKPTTIKLAPGEHLLVATSKDGKDIWKQVISLDKPAQKVVVIALLPVKQAREQDEIGKRELEKAQAQDETGKRELEKAQAQEVADQAEAAKQQELRKQAAKDKQRRIADLRLQVSNLQNLVADDEEAINTSEQAIQQAEEDCARMNLAPGVPCFRKINEAAAQGMEQEARQQANEHKAQIRDLERKISEIQNQ